MSYDDLDSILEESVLYAISAALTHRGFEVKEGGESSPPTQWENGYQKITRSGNSYTIEVTISSGDGGDGQLDDQADELLQEYKTEIFDHYAEVIPPLFDDWRDVELLSGLVGEREALQDGLTWINISPGSARAGGGGGFAGGEISRALDKLYIHMDDLRGRYVEAFHANYVSRVDEATGNNAVLMSALEIAMVAQYEVIKAVRDDIGKLATAFRGALKQSGALPSGTDETAIKIAVVGALFSAVGIVGTGGLALAASGASAGTGLLGSILGATKDEKEIEVSGSHPDDVIDDLQSQLTTYKSEVRNEEQDIADKLDALAATAAGEGDPDESQPDFTLGRAGVTRGRDAGQIFDETEDDADIKFTRRNVNAIVDNDIPGIGGCFDEARKGLRVGSGPFNRPYQVGLGSTGIFSSYDALQDVVVENLNNLKKNLDAAGDTLLIAVDHLGQADGGVNERLDQQAKRLDQIEEAQLQQERLLERLENRPPHILPPGGVRPY